MRPVERIFVWLSGYSPRVVENHPAEDREPLAKLGGLVLLAMIVASSNWGVAGWSFSTGHPMAFRPVIAGLSGLLGAAIVLGVDRSALFFIDTTPVQTGWRIILFALFRIALVLAVSAVTSQAVIPALLDKELAAHALTLIEQSETERLQSLNSQFKIEERKVALGTAANEVTRIERAAATVPPDIERKLLAAKRCWSEHAAIKQRLLEQGYSDQDVRERLAGNAARCARDARHAADEREAHFKRVRAQLDQAIAAKSGAVTDLVQAQSTVQTKIERAARVESEAISPQSSTVLWSLLRTDPGALVKWLLITSALLAAELAPMLLKLLVDQTTIGRKIATSSEFTRLDLEQTLENRYSDRRVASRLNVLSEQAVRDALEDPLVLATFKRVFAAHLGALAPVEAVRKMMRELEQRHFDMAEFQSRFPRYATLIAEAWRAAIRETANILARGLGAASI